MGMINSVNTELAELRTEGECPQMSVSPDLPLSRAAAIAAMVCRVVVSGAPFHLCTPAFLTACVAGAWRQKPGLWQPGLARPHTSDKDKNW